MKGMESIMKRISRILACLALLAALTRAEFPAPDMGPSSLGIQYGLVFRGQNITDANVPSNETGHSLTLGYAPLPYVAVEAGVGVDRLSVQTRNAVGFEGDYGFSPNFGLTLSTPHLLDLVRAVGGAKFLYLNSRDSRGYRYSGLVSNPFLGAVVSPSVFFDCAAGMRLHFIDGYMRPPGGTETGFANGEILRGYASFTVKAPAERVFLTLEADVSPELDSDWSRGPREASVGISFGALLGWKAKSGAPKDSSVYFPAYREMKERQKRMSEEIE
jgi:hypothetical protein